MLNKYQKVLILISNFVNDMVVGKDCVKRACGNTGTFVAIAGTWIEPVCRT